MPINSVGRRAEPELVDVAAQRPHWDAETGSRALAGATLHRKRGKDGRRVREIDRAICARGHARGRHCARSTRPSARRTYRLSVAPVAGSRMVAHSPCAATRRRSQRCAWREARAGVLCRETFAMLRNKIALIGR